MNTIEIQKIVQKQQNNTNRLVRAFSRSKAIGTHEDVVVVDAVLSIYKQLGYIPDSASRVIEEIEARLDAKRNNELAIAIAQQQQVELEIAYQDKPEQLDALHRQQD
jgi:hypothetical protein